MTAEIRTESIEVRRTALFASLGPEPSPAISELWYVLHGQGMRAVPFLDGCRAIAAPSRLIVAPEALSRYYEGAIRSKNAAVVASWMTRDQRDSEICDYVRYLDDLHASLAARFGGTPPPVTIIGFSQGARRQCVGLRTAMCSPRTSWSGRRHSSRDRLRGQRRHPRAEAHVRLRYEGPVHHAQGARPATRHASRSEPAACGCLVRGWPQAGRRHAQRDCKRSQPLRTGVDILAPLEPRCRQQRS